MKDRFGNTYAKLSELKEGDTVALDTGFPCHKSGPVALCVRGDKLGFDCDEGFHSLQGQLADEAEDDSLIGIYKI